MIGDGLVGELAAGAEEGSAKEVSSPFEGPAEGEASESTSKGSESAEAEEGLGRSESGNHVENDPVDA